MAEFKTLNGVAKQPSGSVSVVKESSGHIRMRISKGRVTFDVTLPPSIARRLAELLSEAAGPETPDLQIIDGGEVMSGGGWARVEIMPEGKAFDLVGVTTCGRRWVSSTVPTRFEALSKGRDLAKFLGVALIDGTTAAARMPAHSETKSQRWG